MHYIVGEFLRDPGLDIRALAECVSRRLTRLEHTRLRHCDNAKVKPGATKIAGGW